MHGIGKARCGTARRRERGYILLTLLLFTTLLIIAAAAAASSIAFSIRRDREEELIHRGVQYARAIREFTKKTGRYPLRLEELDDTSGRRFLRKHYKDPITGKDFKLLHLTDIQFINNAPLPAAAGASGDASPGDSGATGSNAAAADPATAAPADSADDPKPAPGSQSGMPAGTRGVTNVAAGISAPPSQPLSGGLIVGVVSTSKDQSIREFSRKKHYNEWKFYYDTALDRYFLNNAPTEKPSFQFGMAQPGLSAAGNPQPGAPQPSPPAAQ